MPIPSQNDFLLPFLTQLSNGQRLTRAQMRERLIRTFSLTDADLKETSGNQNTLTSRIALCDVNLVMAGLVSKAQHPTDSQQDLFSITATGTRELNRGGRLLTVGYLRDTYRGKVYRGAGSEETSSTAELVLLEAFDKLPDDFTVLHAVKWFGRGGNTSVGEIDFLIAHPAHGVLVLEVKGGVISIQQGEWYSTGRNGRISPIKDPCKQADRSRWALSDHLGAHPQAKNLRFAIFPAIAFPDSRVAGNIRPDCPKDIFIDLTHLDNLEARLMQIFAYWKSHADVKNSRMDGQKAVDALVSLFVPTRTLQPRIADLFAQENRKIEELTRQQFGILKVLRYQKRAAVVGGAGTGKTLLAIEKATQLADAGLRVLFVCYNNYLDRWVNSHLKHPNIEAYTFHKLVRQMLDRARVATNEMDWREFDEAAPDLLLDATSILHSADADPKHLYDAIIVDEAQDFVDTWWIGLMDSLKRPQEDVFYVFYDNNQRLFTSISQIPMDGAPLYLEENLRNTRHIHARLSAYAGGIDLQPMGPEGRPVEIIPVADKAAERRELQRVLHRLVNEEGIAAEDIIVLTPAGDKRSQWKKDDQLGNFILTWDLQTEMQMAARVCTIYSYKGLESPVVILTELHALRDDIRDQLLYVGLSRARHHIVVLGELPMSQAQLAAIPRPPAPF